MAFNSHVVKQVEPKCHKVFAKQKFTFSKIYYIVHTIYILYTDTQTHTHTHTHTQAFLLHLIKTWERTTEKRQRIGKHKLNEWEHWIWSRKSATS